MKCFFDNKGRFVKVYSKKHTKQLLTQPVILPDGSTVLDRFFAQSTLKRLQHKLCKHGVQTKSK